MPLKYPGAWKFDGFPHAMPKEADTEFFRLIEMIAEGADNAQTIYEYFKSGFGMESVSSSASWAITDLIGAMNSMLGNAARYVAGFYSGMEAAARSGVEVPSVASLNAILAKWDVPLVIDPPNLLLRSGDAVVSNSSAVDPPGALAYVRGRELGRGGFGVVHLVTRKTLMGDYDFAMKVLNPSVFIENKERALARFKREMQALAMLQQRGIVQMLEAGIDHEQKPYFLMPYVKGEDIKTAMSGAYSSAVFSKFDEILRSLEFAHSRGVVHRDLKPSNILIRESDGQPIILDFGCAYMFDQVDDSLTTTLIGTCGYVPVEVLRNPKLRTHKQDIYACGVLLYQLLAGHLPDPDDYQPIEGRVD